MKCIGNWRKLLKAPETLEAVKREVRPGLWLDSRLALILEEEKTLVLSDLHWGYARVQRKEGNLFPLWGDAEIERRILELLREFRPKRMIWLGDSIHGAAGSGAAEGFLQKHASGMETVLLEGNHDRGWKFETRKEYLLGSYYFHHGDQARSVPEGCCEVVGHWHPSSSHRDGAGLRLKLPVLVEQPRRLILPAFSPWSRGSDWRETEGDTLWILAQRRIFRKVCRG